MNKKKKLIKKGRARIQRMVWNKEKNGKTKNCMNSQKLRESELKKGYRSSSDDSKIFLLQFGVLSDLGWMKI